MLYQHVLQFRGETLDDYDAMILLEDQLCEALGQSETVDGHDAGSGETNIFIITPDPNATFFRVRQVVQIGGRLHALAAAYREVDGEDYTVIWPEDSTKEFKVV